MWNLPPGFMSAMWGTRAATRLKSSSDSATPASLAMARRCSTALVDPPRALTTVMAFSNASWREDLAGRDAQLQHARPRPGRPRGRRPRGAGRRRAARPMPGRLSPRASADGGHGVGGEHAGAGALAGAGPALDGAELLLGDGAGGAGADGLEDAHDVERHALVVAGQDRAVVDEHRRQVEAGRRHQHGRDALVAAGEADEAVEALGVHDRLDRVGDDLARHERGVHALVPHRDAVGHGDGAELEREARRPPARPPWPARPACAA